MLSCQTFEKSDLGLLFAWYFYCRKCFAITFWHPKMYLFRKKYEPMDLVSAIQLFRLDFLFCGAIAMRMELLTIS